MSTTTAPITTPTAARRTGGRPLTHGPAHPTVTLLLPTEPARTITPADRRALDELATSAIEQLTGEVTDDELVVLRAQLAIAVESAGVGGTDLGLAVLVDAARAESVTLPLAPHPRVLVDELRPSVRPSWEPGTRHRVLVLSATRYRILEGRRGALADRTVPPAGSSQESGPAAVRSRHHRRPDRWLLREERGGATVHDAEVALASLDRTRHLPVVVVGPTRWVQLFVDRARSSCEIIGTVVGHRIDDPAAGIATLVAPVIDQRIDRRSSLILASLEDAARTGRLRWGLAEAWRAVITSQAEQLWVPTPNSAALGDTAVDDTAVDDTALDGTASDHTAEPGDNLGDLLVLAAVQGAVAMEVPASSFAGLPGSVAVLLRRPTAPVPALTPAGAWR